MPRKNKRKFFGGKSNKSKTVKLSEEQDDQNAQVDIKKQQSNESDTEENNAEGEFQLRKSAVHSSISSVSNDSTVSTPETNATKMGAKFSSSPRWCSEPNLTANNNSLRQQRATIQLKIIQFIGNTSATEISEAVKEEENLHEDENVFHAAGAVPKLDHYKEDEANEPQQQKQQRFDDNYRVESPKQISSLSHDLIGIDDENNDKEDECRNKRHAMLIQEISESSSSEEVKKYLDNEASAIEMKMIEKIDSIKPYRVESPASSDENSNKLSSQTDDNNLAQTVHEICESSSSESVKNDEKTKIATLNLKIINIQELPTENNNKTSTLSSSSPSPKAKIKLFECKSEKKLNKAEEAIIEALYGNNNLLQIPNTPLDVISEEGSDCCSDIDATTTKLQHHKTTTYENDIEDDDDVFLKSSTTTIAQRYRRNKKIAAIEEQPLLINTKLIETEINVPESCKKWETRQSDSELQAELVYLPSTSSSATDLSERSTDTEEVEEETSEDTETNSLLENITVPPLTLDITTIPTSAEQEHEHIYINDQLPDILEEDEDPKSITESQQLIEDVNKELHHLENFTVENKNKNLGDEKQEPKIALETNLIVRDDDDKKLINEQRQENSKSGTPTPTQPRRKYSSDSSTSSSNSQCTIIRQVMPIESIHPLKDLCMRSLDNYNNISTEGKVTVQKRCNSISRNAPNIPIINELELHYECDSDDLQSHEKKDKVITILQVPPEINNNNQSNSRSSSEEKKRWFGMQSSQMPNVMVALSPSQKVYMMTSSDSNATTTSADVLLDMHKKFVERRAYHEVSDDDDDDNGNNKNILRCENAKSEEIQLEDSNRSSNNGCSKSSSDESAIKLKIVESDIDNESSNSCRSSLVINDNRESAENKQQELNNEEENMNTIRSLILREKFFNDNKNEPSTAPIVTSDEFKVKKCELEDELIRLDYERKELEEELRNIQSLQHFKREEFLYNQRKLQKQQEENKNVEHEIVVETNHNRHSMNNGKYVNDDFSDFINSNEKLHKEIYNEWQDKVLERNERKLQKTLKITSINEITRDELQPLFRERAASERIIKLNDEFLERVKERQKRLSLPLDDNLDASTESLLNDDDDHNVGGARKKKKKFFHFDNKENFPAHFREFIEYCEQEIEISKNSVESGESLLKNPLFIGLIGVSMCICGFYIGKHFITKNSNFS